MMISLAEENHLKAIYKLSFESRMRKGIPTNAIAERLNTKAASVTDMLKKLSEKKFINYRRYQGVTLTDTGKKVAVGIVRKHRLWEFFLVETLKFKWDEVHEIAEQLEHIQSEELITRLDEFLGHPKIDPHGDPIPDEEGRLLQTDSEKLSDVDAGKKWYLSGVINHSSSFLKYLEKSGLMLGSQVVVLEKFDFDKSLTISVNGGESTFISKDVAMNILVSSKKAIKRIKK